MEQPLKIGDRVITVQGHEGTVVGIGSGQLYGLITVGTRGPNYGVTVRAADVMKAPALVEL